MPAIPTQSLELLQSLDAVIDRDRDGQVERIQLLGQRINDGVLQRIEGIRSLRSLDLIYAKITNAGIESIRKLERLKTLDLGACLNISDDGLKHLKGMGRLEVLRIWDTAVTDGCFAYMKGLAHLRELYMSGTKITGTGLSYLKRLRNMEGVDLRATQLSDAGLKALSTVASLQWADLSVNEISNAGLNHLVRLKQLRRLAIGHTKITNTGVVAFKRQLHDCAVTR